MELAERFHLKRKLECKTFEWYLTYIYPELEIPKGNVPESEIQTHNIRIYYHIYDVPLIT